MLDMLDAANATVRNSMLALSHLQNLTDEKVKLYTFVDSTA